LNSSIKISGYSPPFKEFDDEDNELIMKKIKKAAPDIIWVCFGGWKQEKWMNHNICNLDKGVMIGVGAAFRWLIGDIITPPQIFQNMGFLWLFRMINDIVKKPITSLKEVHRRRQLSSKLIFMLHFPHEVIMARKRLKLNMN
ncbi:MAG: WecB/TagA/CpsF family glycosyltransferase, partial [Methylococcales bacterium]